MELIDEMNVTYKPHSALLIFKKDHPVIQVQDHFYIEQHEIDQNGNMGPGAPLTLESIKELAEVFYLQKKENERVTGILPEYLINFRLNNDMLPDMIWYRKARQMELIFTKDLHIQDGPATLPAMLFSIKNQNLYVFALNDDYRPDGQTALFQPPFHNCSSNGMVCLGNAKVKRPNQLTWSGLINYWELLFFKSKFTHINDATVRANLNLLWKQQIQNPLLPFDNNLLLSTNLTLKDLL